MEAAIDASYRCWKHQARARSIHGVRDAASRFRKVLLQGQQGHEIVCARSGEIIGSDSLPREKREELGDEVMVDEEVPVDGGKLELRWPPWEGLPERYRIIGPLIPLCHPQQEQGQAHGEVLKDDFRFLK